MSGCLIVFDGIDGGGKTTQAKALKDMLILDGYDAVYFREPSDGRWGREIRAKAAVENSITPEEELNLFLKDRKENVELNLKPAIEAGKIVILDRYYFSTIAYQGAKGIDPDKILEMNERFAVKPDLVYFLDIEAGPGLARVESRGPRALLFEREDYLALVRKIFRGFQGENYYHINASRPVEEVSREIQQIAREYLAKR